MPGLIRQSVQVRRNAHVEIIPLSTGCLGACTYCKTRHARGALGSYELDAIASRARKAAADPLVRLLRLGLGLRVRGLGVADPPAALQGSSRLPGEACKLGNYATRLPDDCRLGRTAAGFVWGFCCMHFLASQLQRRSVCDALHCMTQAAGLQNLTTSLLRTVAESQIA